MKAGNGQNGDRGNGKFLPPTPGNLCGADFARIDARLDRIEELLIAAAAPADGAVTPVRQRYLQILRELMAAGVGEATPELGERYRQVVRELTAAEGASPRGSNRW